MHAGTDLESVRDTVGTTAESLRAWLTRGAAQSADGAYVAWLDAATGAASYEYPEITGYALTYLAQLPTLSPEERANGERAAGWLVERLDRGDLSARSGWDNGAVYVFDLAMVASGLLSFGSRIGAERLVDTGLRLVDLLEEHMDADGPLSPVSAHAPASARSAWSTHGRAHLAKVVQALLVGEELGQVGSGSAAATLIEAVKRLQHDDGRFDTGPENVTMLHPHLYAAEGLWMWGVARGDADATARARAAVEWVWGMQLPNGGFPRFEDGAAEDEQSDVTAQAVRLALMLEPASPDVDRGVARLVELAQPHDEGRAMLYQPHASRRHFNTWATMFAAQALAVAASLAESVPWQAFV